MKSTLHRALLLVFAAAAPLLTNCAPERAMAIRQDKSLTLGLPGASFRPNGKVGIGSTFAWGTSDSTVTPKAQDGTTLVSTPANDRLVTTKETQISPFVQYFPWDTSAFFVGAGASYRMSKLSYDETRTGSTGLAPSYTGVAYNRNSTYASVPLGWAWIWNSGFSLTFDFGPRVRVSQSTSYTKNGAGDGVDADQRDRTVKAINQSESFANLGGGSGMIGWSF